MSNSPASSRSISTPSGGLSRRGFLRGLLAGGVGFATAPVLLRRSFAADAIGLDDTVTVSILHTTDLHGRVLGDTVRGFGADVGGIARCATQIRRWRAENPNTILLDLGDLYQGTDVGWRSDGRIMTDCLNALRYDAWSLGNHEFDWGIEPVRDALLHAEAPVIGTNLLVEGNAPGSIEDRDNPLSRIEPWTTLEVGGVRIGLLGFTTPGMPYWFPPAFHEGMEFRDCADPARKGEAALRAAGIDALVLFGHMGLRPDGDNQSNQVRSVIEACPSAAAYIGAHSHRLHRDDRVGETIYTQANFWGSHLGRLDLIFDRDSRRLVGRRTELAFMGPQVPQDPVIVDLCRERLDDSATALAQPVGTLERPLRGETAPGSPSEVERLIAAAIMAALAERGTPVDGVIHGQFTRGRDVAPGEKTVADLWPIMPYENFTLVAELHPAQIGAILKECWANSERNLMGLSARARRDGERWRVEQIVTSDGSPVDPERRYRIAFNTWDAQSGGGRLMRMRAILHEPESRSTVHRVQTRQALIEFFMRHGSIGEDALSPVVGGGRPIAR